MRWINKNGFTLIELLVVVLIIGILAAIALPRYTIAVKLSKIKGHIYSLRPVMDAEARYKLCTGFYGTDIDALDVSYPYISKEPKGSGTLYTTDWGFFLLFAYDSSETNPCYIRVYLNEFGGITNNSLNVALFAKDKPSAQFAGYDGFCSAKNSDEDAGNICKHMGTFVQDSGDYKMYGISF